MPFEAPTRTVTTRGKLCLLAWFVGSVEQCTVAYVGLDACAGPVVRSFPTWAEAVAWVDGEAEAMDMGVQWVGS